MTDILKTLRSWQSYGPDPAFQSDMRAAADEVERLRVYAEKIGAVVLRFMREIPPQHIPGDLYTLAGSLVNSSSCDMCGGTGGRPAGICPVCEGSGEGPVVTYGGGPVGDGEMPTDCPKCKGTGAEEFGVDHSTLPRCPVCEQVVAPADLDAVKSNGRDWHMKCLKYAAGRSGNAHLESPPSQGTKA